MATTIDDGFAATLAELLRQEMPFVMYSLPGSEEVSLLVDDNSSEIMSPRCFTVVDWHGREYSILDRKYISHSYSNLNFGNAGKNDGEVYCATSRNLPLTTSWEEYSKGINHVLELLRGNHGKVVISRCVSMAGCNINLDVIASAVCDMFKAYTPTFRAVYFTPATGAWCVCSPELLLKVDKSTGDFNTIALAGTRPKKDISHNNDGMGWDDKNLREHRFVVDHITSQLSKIAAAVNVAPAETLTTGSIQHLLTRINGTLTIDGANMDDMIGRTLSLLHPTPAICGYPVAWAREVIGQVEAHDRECYGGYFSLEDDNAYIAHVNLRCFAFDAHHCRFFGGGGILADSDPRKEWDEASSKINATAKFFCNESK